MKFTGIQDTFIDKRGSRDKNSITGRVIHSVLLADPHIHMLRRSAMTKYYNEGKPLQDDFLSYNPASGHL